METTKITYNPAEVELLVKHLTHGIFDPEYILLFGSLVGATRHSDATAYDLLMVVRETPTYNWLWITRTLRHVLPIRQREIAHVNLYVMRLDEVESRNTPFLYFAHRDGKLLYCKDHHHFTPKRYCDFSAAYCDAKLHYDTFILLGNQFLERAQSEYCEFMNMRTAALFTAQAAVYFYHTLYYVFNGEDFKQHDPVILHERTRTLSMQVMLAMDDDHVEGIFTLPTLKHWLDTARYDLHFDVAPKELEHNMERVEHLATAVERVCEMRLEIYKELGA